MRFVRSGNGKTHDIGLFQFDCRQGIPAIHPQLAVYVALTDGRGVVPFKIQMVDIDEEAEPIFQAEGEVEFIDPRIMVEMDFHFGGITLSHPGEYPIQLIASGEFLLERRIVVQQLPGE